MPHAWKWFSKLHRKWTRQVTCAAVTVLKHFCTVWIPQIQRAGNYIWISGKKSINFRKSKSYAPSLLLATSPKPEKKLSYIPTVAWMQCFIDPVQAAGIPNLQQQPPDYSRSFTNNIIICQQSQGLLREENTYYERNCYTFNHVWSNVIEFGSQRPNWVGFL